MVGPLLILASVVASLVLTGRAMRRRLSGMDENRLVFALFAAFSGVLSIAFVIWGWDENGDWRYRYLAMAVAFAAAFLATLPVRTAALPRRPGWLAAGAVASLLALSVIPAADGETRGRSERNQKFLGQVAHLEQVIAKHSTTLPYKGLGEYRLVMDITARTGLPVHLLDEKARFQFYNNNVGSLCDGGYSFILRKMRADAPRRSEVVARLGEPQASEQVEIDGHAEVEVMFYNPAVLQSGIVEEGRKRATDLFPSFHCSGSH